MEKHGGEIIEILKFPLAILDTFILFLFDLKIAYRKIVLDFFRSRGDQGYDH